MTSRRVVVTGIGVVTPVGKEKDSFWNSICGGKSGIAPIALFDASRYTSRIAGEVQDFDPSSYLDRKQQRRMARFVQFAVVAALDAVKDAGLEGKKEDGTRMGVVIGSGIGGIWVIEEQHTVLREKGPGRVSPFFIPSLIGDMASGEVSILLGAKGPNSCVTTACASAAHSIGDAFRIIERGEADIMIAGGTEAGVSPMGVAGFCAMRALSCRNEEPERASRPFDRERDGFVIAEGAGVLVLENLEHARRRGAFVYGEMAGYGMTGDAHHVTAPAPGGEGAARAMQLALENAKVETTEVDLINAHGTSTQLNDKAETQAIKSVFGKHAYRLAVNSTKSMIGHLLGASGGVELAACLLTLVNGIIPPTINYENQDPECDLDYVPNQARKKEVRVVLSNSLGFGGHNASLVVKKYER